MDTTLIKGLRVLETLANSADPLSLAEIAAATGLGKSNAHRVLKTLIHCGYARQDPVSARYHCTLKMWKFGCHIVEQLDLRAIARPHLRKLSETTSQTVHLAILENDEVTYIEKIDGLEPVVAYSRLGGGGPLHCSASGKAILAFAPDDVIARVGKSLRRFTPNTIVDPARLAREIQTIRRQGYAVTRGEWHEAMSGIAAPIFARQNVVFAAVGVFGLLSRMNQPRLRKYAPLVIETAQAISREIA
jgi:IclR family KDG regulon transcriptional repressor